MAGYYLSITYGKFVKETDWLLLEFDEAINRLSASSVDKPARLTAEMSVIRLHDAWARFSREIVVLSAGGRPYTANGYRLPTAPGIRKISDVIPLLLRSYSKPRRYEPKWARSQECIQAAQLLHIPNFSTFAAAIGATNSPAEDLRPIRNFLAHRGEDSAKSVRNQSFFTNGTGKVNVEGVAGKLVPPGITLFEKWIIDFRLVAGAAIQY